MNYKCISPPLFNINDKELWLEFLKVEGYVVINDILTNEERSSFIDEFYIDFNKVTPNFDFKDNKTWNKNTYPGMYGKGICSFNGFGQSNFMWILRTKNKIQQIFRTIYNTKQLITSMDGFSLFVNNEQKSKQWNHIDQNPQNKICSYQSAYNYFPVTEGDAGFIIAPHSHKEFNPEVSHLNDWIVLDDDNQWNDKVVKLLIPSNCLTIWNSKSIHSNTGMNKKCVELNRLTCYLTYLPRSLQTDENKSLRIEAYKNGHTCSHWSNKCEIKKYPWGFKKRYESKGFKRIIPKLINKKIPLDRYVLI
tara:strand:+ start:87 stop:1004 length:918 start_codon:yes stop_codon:yes gene_type:complete